jgi:hypothetical protein
MSCRVGNVRLLATAGGGEFLDRVFDHFTRFTGELLNPADQFFLFAFCVTKIIVRELRPFLFQLALSYVPVPLNFECVHIFCFFVCRQRGEKFLFTSQTHAQGMTHHESERDHYSCHQASHHDYFDDPSFIIHDQKHHLLSLPALWGETPP